MITDQRIQQWKPAAQDAVSRLLGQFQSYQDVATTAGLTQRDIVDVVLGIIDNESHGNRFTLGDPKPGYVVHQPEYWDEAGARLSLDFYNSVGLGQLNFGVGTPQDRGYQGAKIGLIDGNTNVYYTTKNLLHNLLVHRGDLKEAIRGYNGSSKVDANKNGVSDTLEYYNKVIALVGKKKVSPSP